MAGKDKEIVDACHPFLVIDFFFENCNISHIMYQNKITSHDMS